MLLQTIMSLSKKNNKQGERKLLDNVWGEVPPGEISELDLFCFTIFHMRRNTFYSLIAFYCNANTQPQSWAPVVLVKPLC